MTDATALRKAKGRWGDRAVTWKAGRDVMWCGWITKPWYMARCQIVLWQTPCCSNVLGQGPTWEDAFIDAGVTP